MTNEQATVRLRLLDKAVCKVETVAITLAIQALKNEQRRVELLKETKEKSKTSKDYRIYDCARRYLEDCVVE